MDVLSVTAGMRALIMPMSLGGRRLRGHVGHIAVEGVTTQNITVFPTDIVVDEAATLLPEMACDVDVVVAERVNVVAIPTNALVRTPMDQTVVYKVGENNPTRVTTGLIGDTYSEVVDGLRRGDVVTVPNDRPANPSS
jgi:multidrug efflux pump subunit AcrA (membrane-fusion protein)